MANEIEDEIEDETKNITKFQTGIQDRKHVFVLFYMSTCGPCKETKPKWIAFEKSNSDDDVVITHIEMNMLDKIDELIGEQPSGFPTMRYYKGKEFEDYDECSALEPKDRSTESFEKWLKLKTQNKEKTNIKGGKRIRRVRTRKVKRLNKHSIKRGGKWSMKYKKSINCRHPKGFSQKQHCKYGRKR